MQVEFSVLFLRLGASLVVSCLGLGLVYQLFAYVNFYKVTMARRYIHGYFWFYVDGDYNVKFRTMLGHVTSLFVTFMYDSGCFVARLVYVGAIGVRVPVAIFTFFGVVQVFNVNVYRYS